MQLQIRIKNLPCKRGYSLPECDTLCHLFYSNLLIWEESCDRMISLRSTGLRQYSSRLVRSAVVQAVSDVEDAGQSYFSTLVLCTPVLLDL